MTSAEHVHIFGHYGNREWEWLECACGEIRDRRPLQHPYFLPAPPRTEETS